MPRPIQVTIHHTALRKNLAVVRQLAPHAKIWAVIKANAYGHGIERVLPALWETDGFALLDLQEAQRVRDAGWIGPILLLEGVFSAEDWLEAARLRLDVAVHHNDQLQWLAACSIKEPLNVFLKLNSGMNRLGFKPAEYARTWRKARALPQIANLGCMTHFSDADGERGVSHQVMVFDAVTHDLEGEHCLANSAAILHYPEVHRQAVRPGIVLYGGSPDGTGEDLIEHGFVPAMTLSSRVIATQDLKPGDTVGYGSRFIADKPMRIGVVACGYADGYPRHAPTGTPVLVEGQRCSLIGRVSMDMLTVDLSALPEVGRGSHVELWGQHLSVDDVARHAGTIGYELLCAIAPRVRAVVEPLPEVLHG